MATKKKTVVVNVDEVEAALDAAIEAAGPDVIEGLTTGRIVHWVNERGIHRPAIIVNVLDAVVGACTLQVFVDGYNDGFPADQGTMWASGSYNKNAELFSWHWIERA